MTTNRNLQKKEEGREVSEVVLEISATTVAAGAGALIGTVGGGGTGAAIGMAIGGPAGAAVGYGIGLLLGCLGGGTAAGVGANKAIKKITE